ncbi:hypothetical protein BWQ96_06989 [Gracilariopsis chorda]|uniref:Uncharacterized protein n=1 Tax=Gracilariopsis chorda TaxID=448386 RepID=A0A2V3IMG4_9FLOR|nr:hypothetical protein BWQ96_06989 [Gracilariopsis chorda]|eukprot:PXF43262.1 hypothetical protein BWQ96_06989 [Gracilariopsis chorda]
MNMGYKWAIYIAHMAAQKIIEQKFRIFQYHLHRRRPAPRILPPTKNTIVLYQNPGDAVCIHIIDDIDFNFSYWSNQEATTFKRLCYNKFEDNGLPVKNSTSCPIRSLVQSTIPFIGWRIDLPNRLSFPDPAKTIKTTQQVFQIGQPQHLTQELA